MKQKLEKLDKARKKALKECAVDQSGEIPMLHGCPVPEPITCSGEKPSTTSIDDGVLMECTNIACPFKEVPVHDVCFEAYEEYLIRTMSTMGSARGWSDTKLRTNLWEKKGQGLVAKIGRCRCGHGTTRRNENAFTAREEKKRLEAMQANGLAHKKKKTKKELPTLNFPRPVVFSTGSEFHASRPRIRRPTNTQRLRQYSTCTSYSEDFDDEIPDYSQDDAHLDDAFIPTSHPLRQTKSYATATKEVAADSGADSKIDIVYPPSSCSDITKDMVSPPLTPFSQVHDVHMESPVALVHQHASPIASIIHTPPSSATPKTTGKEERAVFLDWSPWTNCDFDLGESILAARYLPRHW